MKKTIIILLLSFIGYGVSAQTTYQLNYDSVRVGKTDNSSGIALYGDIYLKNTIAGLLRLNADRKFVTTTLAESDIPSLSISKVAGLQDSLANKYSKSDANLAFIKNQTALQSGNFNISGYGRAKQVSIGGFASSLLLDTNRGLIITPAVSSGTASVYYDALKVNKFYSLAGLGDGAGGDSTSWFYDGVFIPGLPGMSFRKVVVNSDSTLAGSNVEQQSFSAGGFDSGVQNNLHILNNAIYFSKGSQDADVRFNPDSASSYFTFKSPGYLGVGADVVSEVDGALAPAAIKISNTGDSHVVLSSVASNPHINEIYFEYQDGAGNRVTAGTFGLDNVPSPSVVISSQHDIRMVKNDSAYPHPDLFNLNTATGVLKLPAYTINGLVKTTGGDGTFEVTTSPDIGTATGASLALTGGIGIGTPITPGVALSALGTDNSTIVEAGNTGVDIAFIQAYSRTGSTGYKPFLINGKTLTFGTGASATTALTIDDSQVATFPNSPIVPTPTAGDNSTKVATTAYVDAAVSPGTSGTPTIAVNANAGTGATASIVGNNINGVVTINFTGVSAANGVMATITMGGGFSYATKCTPVLTLESGVTGVAAGAGDLITTSGTSTTWDISIAPSNLTTPGTFKFNYHNGGY